MFKINNNNFKILIKYKDFEKILSDYLINIPKTDKFYKEYMQSVYLKTLNYILKLNYEEIKDNKYILRSNIKTK